MYLLFDKLLDNIQSIYLIIYNKMGNNLPLVLLLLSIVFSSEIVSLDSLALTIYNDGYGIVKDYRTIFIDT